MDIVTYILATKGTENLVDELVAKGFEFSTSSSLILISDSEQGFIDKIQIEEERISEFGDYFYNKISDWNEETGCLISLKLPPTYDINLIKLEELDDKADGIVNEVSGDSLVNVNDSDELSLKGLRLFGKTTQDGTPTPDNPIEFVSTGDSGAVKITIYNENILPYPYVHTNQTINGITFTDNGDGTVTANGTATGQGYFIFFKGRLPKGKYFLSGAPKDGSAATQIYFTNSDYSLYKVDNGSGVAVEVITEEEFIIAINISKDTVANNLVFKPMLNIGLFATTYVPSTSQNLSVATPNGLCGVPVTSGGNYTDDNGQQWICDEIDFKRGVYVQRINQLVLTGLENWRLEPSDTAPFIYTNYLPFIDNSKSPLLYSHGKGIYIGVENNNIGINLYVSGILRLRLGKESSLEDAVNFITEQYNNGTPLSVLYPLATPIETPLTNEELAQFKQLKTNYPITNVLSDSNVGLLVKYTADTKLYIDNKFAEIQNLILQGG